MLEASRRVCDPNYAEDLLKPFGQTLKSVGIKPIKTNQMYRLNYAEEDAEKPSVAIYDLAQSLAQKLTGIRVSSGMHGQGSYAQDITEKAVSLIEDHETSKRYHALGDALGKKYRELEKGI